jgi:hypothetical protein
VEKLLARLERRFGRYAPRGITIWLVGLSGAVYLLLWVRPELIGDFVLDREALARGEVWRLVTFLFLPWETGRGTFGPILLFFALWFLYIIGTSLEAQWGTFRFDVYYLIGALGTVAAALVVGTITNEYLNLSLLLAFAVEFPDYEILLFLILPLKMKWAGLLGAAGAIWILLTGSLRAKVGVAVALANFLIFCGPDVARMLRANRPRKRVSGFGPPEKRTRVCAKCGRSDKDDPSLEFRVCDCQEVCRGKLTEYCLDHARTPHV